MKRLEVSLGTGSISEVPLSPEEEASALAARLLIDQENTPDKLAARAIDSMERLQFEHLFLLENRIRVLEAKAQITRLQYRTALINLWKDLNPS